MCDFISGYIGWNGEFYFGDLKSHASAEELHGLSKALASAHPPVPFEWTKDDDGRSITARVPD